MILASRPTRLLAALALAAVLLAGCSKDKDDDAAPKKRATTTTAAPGAPTLSFTVTETNTNGTKGPDDTQLSAIRRALDGWLATAVVAPLHSGQPAPDLTPFFTAAALERVTTDPAVRATLVDEGLPPASTSIAAEVANVILSTVAGPDEVLAVVGARIDLKVHAVGPTLDVDVVHQGELVLAPEEGVWKIESFAIHTARDSRA